MSERFLADENFPRALARILRASGYDLAHVHDFMAGADDPAVAAEAASRGAILLTFDRDFGELTFHRRLASAGIVLFRLGRQPADVIFSHVQAFLASQPSLRGYFTVVTVNQVRQRPVLRVIDDET